MKQDIALWGDWVSWATVAPNDVANYPPTRLYVWIFCRQAGSKYTPKQLWTPPIWSIMVVGDSSSKEMRIILFSALNKGDVFVCILSISKIVLYVGVGVERCRRT